MPAVLQSANDRTRGVWNEVWPLHANEREGVRRQGSVVSESRGT